MVDCRLEILPRRGECDWKLEFFISDIDVHQNTDFSENITLLPLITGVLLAKILKTVRVNVYSSAKKHLLEYCGWLFMCNVHQCQSGRTLQDRKLSVSDGPPPEGALGTAKTQNYIRYLPTHCLRRTTRLTPPHHSRNVSDNFDINVKLCCSIFEGGSYSGLLLVENGVFTKDNLMRHFFKRAFELSE